MTGPINQIAELHQDRTHAGLVFTKSIVQLDLFNDTVKEYDKKYSARIGAIDKTAETPYLKWAAEMVDFGNLRLTLSIVHLVTIFEAYLLDTVREILLSQSEALKTGRQLTYREIFSCADMDSLKALAVEREVEQLGYGSYKQIAKYYSDKFNLDFGRLRFGRRTNLDNEHVEFLISNGSLQKTETAEANGLSINQESVTEVFATRNILVHNQGIVNRTSLMSRISAKRRARK